MDIETIEELIKRNHILVAWVPSKEKFLIGIIAPDPTAGMHMGTQCVDIDFEQAIWADNIEDGIHLLNARHSIKLTGE